MRFMKIMLVLGVCVMTLSLLASASENQFGVGDARQIKFDSPTWVGGTLLPSGTYQVLHTMQGESHIMVFEQKGGRKPAEVSVKCTLVPLQAKASRDEVTYLLNDKDERVLHALIFRGDKAIHQF